LSAAVLDFTLQVLGFRFYVLGKATALLVVDLGRGLRGFRRVDKRQRIHQSERQTVDALRLSTLRGRKILWDAHPAPIGRIHRGWKLLTQLGAGSS